MQNGKELSTRIYNLSEMSQMEQKKTLLEESLWEVQMSDSIPNLQTIYSII